MVFFFGVMLMCLFGYLIFYKLGVNCICNQVQIMALDISRLKWDGHQSSFFIYQWILYQSSCFYQWQCWWIPVLLSLLFPLLQLLFCRLFMMIASSWWDQWYKGFYAGLKKFMIYVDVHLSALWRMIMVLSWVWVYLLVD